MKRFSWLVIPLVMSGCYNYYPVGQPGAYTGQSQQVGPQQRSLPQNQAAVAQKPLPVPPAPVQPGQPPQAVQPQSSSMSKDQVEQEIASAHKECTTRIPDAAGHRAELIRCMVAGSDAVLDRVDPQSTQQRHALGAYAVQLAEREDKGEITREQAENYYQQFLQQTPGYGQGAPQQ